MKNKIQEKKQVRIALRIFTLVLFCTLLITVVKKAFSQPLDNDVRVDENTPLTYYLNINYDGVDKNGVKSDDTTVSQVHSGTMFIEDKIPDGLIFDGFVTTGDGSIGAVKRSDGTICTGKVIDDTQEENLESGTWNADKTEYYYHGLHYNVNTRLVTFSVKNLQAGCELTVGIKTITPPTVDDPNTPEKELRRDFYNFATAREKSLTVSSNITHAFMQIGNATLYNVTYEYTGDIPSNAPNVPVPTMYAPNSNVGIAPDVKLEGYTFSGWEAEGITVNGASFIMPEADVKFTGSFTEIPKNKVSYLVDGTMPDGYEKPNEKEYYPNSIVSLDVLKEGDVFNGYRFLGWKNTNVALNEDRQFVMPNEDVTFVGEFEEVTYKVTYKFDDAVLPPNADAYLPKEKSYRPGEKVMLEDIVSEPDGYKFLGWYKEKEFIMPEDNVTILGEWKRLLGTFAPTIQKELVDIKDYYRIGDSVKFKITVTNTATFPIKSVMINEKPTRGEFIEGEGYTVRSTHLAEVESLDAGASVSVYAVYKVGAEDKGTIENVAEIIGASADNKYELEDKEFKATASFKTQSSIKVCALVDGASTDNVFQYHITGDNQFDIWLALKKDECETIYVDPTNYKIKEIVPGEYEIKKVEGAVDEDNKEFAVEEFNDYEVKYINKFKKKGFLHSFGRVLNKIGGR